MTGVGRLGIAALVLIVCVACTNKDNTTTVDDKDFGNQILPSATVSSPTPTPTATGSATGGGGSSGSASHHGSGATSTAAPASTHTPAAAPAPTPAYTNASGIQGVVREGGHPLAGTNVSITGNGVAKNTSTRSDGTFKVKVPAGSYTVDASAPGCGSHTATVSEHHFTYVTITCG